MAKTKQLMIRVEDKAGTIAEAIGALSKVGVNITSVFGWAPAGVIQLGVDNSRKAAKALTGAGIRFEEMKAELADLPNKPGSLHTYLAKLAKKGVNIRSICGTTSASAGKSRLVWTASD